MWAHVGDCDIRKERCEPPQSAERVLLDLYGVATRTGGISEPNDGERRARAWGDMAHAAPETGRSYDASAQYATVHARRPPRRDAGRLSDAERNADRGDDATREGTAARKINRS